MCVNITLTDVNSHNHNGKEKVEMIRGIRLHNCHTSNKNTLKHVMGQSFTPLCEKKVRNRI